MINRVISWIIEFFKERDMNEQQAPNIYQRINAVMQDKSIYIKKRQRWSGYWG